MTLGYKVQGIIITEMLSCHDLIFNIYFILFFNCPLHKTFVLCTGHQVNRV